MEFVVIVLAMPFLIWLSVDKKFWREVAEEIHKDN